MLTCTVLKSGVGATFRHLVPDRGQDILFVVQDNRDYTSRNLVLQ